MPTQARPSLHFSKPGATFSMFVLAAAVIVLLASCHQSSAVTSEQTPRKPSMYQHCEYFLRIFPNDGRYIHRIDFGCHGEAGFADGIIPYYDPSRCLVGYDTSILAFDTLAVYPKSEGTTFVHLVYPPEAGVVVDSLQVTVFRDSSNSKLILQTKPEF